MYRLLFLPLLMLSISGFAQTKKTKKTPNGLEYILHVDNKGPKAKLGNYVKAYMLVQDHLGNVLFGEKDPQYFQVIKPSFSGDLMDGIVMLGVGDSASFYVPTDSLRRFLNLPAEIPNGVKIVYSMKTLEILNEEQFQNLQQQFKKDQINAQIEEVRKVRESMAEADKEKTQADIVLIEKYLADSNITAKRTESGVYYVIENPLPGEKAKAGQRVRVHYTGTLLNGRKFDSSKDRKQPFDFNLGVGEVIAGWDDGIAMFSKGEKGLIFIPSTLAYRDTARPGIPENSILVFEVELLDIND